MKKFWPFLLLLLPVVLALALPRFIGGNDEPVPVVQCADPVKGCQVSFPKGTAEVRFMSTPLPLKPFELLVKAPDASQVATDFAMQDMNMGRNRYILQRGTDSAWHGNIVLPVCVSGSSRWIMTLELDGVQRQMLFVVTK